MCWLPVEQPLLVAGASSCGGRRPSCSVAQLLAWRLRRIGDQLEKSWTARELDSGRGRLRSFLCTAIHLTVLVLVAAKRHF